MMDFEEGFNLYAGDVQVFEENINLNLEEKAPPEKEWYHGRLDRKTSEDRLLVTNKVGSYLVRKSDRRPGSYVLSYLGKNAIEHFRIIATCGDYYIGGRQFLSLSELIGYYSACSDLLKHERLLYPLAPPEPVDDKRRVIATLPYCAMRDTDELSFQKGDIFVVHNDLGDGWLWVANVRTKDSGIVYHGLLEELNSVDPAEALEYFHSDISKEEAAEKLSRAGQGSFLIRPSDHSPGDYALYFLCNKKVHRFKIEKQGRQYFMGRRYFDSIGDIIDRYCREEIIEGYTLMKPVVRERYTVEDTDGFNSGESDQNIYSTMGQSSGSNFLVNRNDKIIMKSYLHRKTEKKKWKKFYFILNATEQTVYIFENEKRSRPKALIDLNNTCIYPTHDSLFDRPNCFQLVIKGLNNDSLLHTYLCADNPDIALDWVMAMRPFCQNKLPQPVRNKKHRLKELRSIHVIVTEAHRVPIKHPCCFISLNEVKVCKTDVKEGPNPIWDEEFILEDIPPDIDSFKVTIVNKAKRSKETEIFQVTQQLSDSPENEMTESWYNLQPVVPTNKGECGSIRLKVRYLHEVIMPMSEYSGLMELLLAKDFEAVLTLDELLPKCGHDRTRLAKALLRIFRHERQEALLLKTLNDLEIHREHTVTTLFRTTSLATTLMDQYKKLTATDFVKAALEKPIAQIMESKQSCELNPNNLENPADATTNAIYLLTILNETLSSLFRARDKCPMNLRYLYGCLQKSTNAKWSDDPTVKTRVVSGFVFLRLLCPAIINPKMFNLITDANISDTPSETAARTLTLVAKCLISLANLHEFGAKEPFMEVVNPFIIRNRERMIAFIDELSDVHDCNVSDEAATWSIARDLATIHQICASHLTELNNMAQTQPSLKKLVTVIEMLSNHKKRYMGET